MAAERTLIQVFAKAPVPGQVKTRLIPRLGEHAATELYCRLVRQTLATAAIARVGSTEVWTTPPGDAGFLKVCARLLGVPVRMQPDGDLGARMSHALRDGLARRQRAMLIGVDVPAMTPGDLREADAALRGGCDAVLGPTEDGGYWLIGLARHHDSLFQDIAWSTPAVAERTRERLRALGWRWHELATRWDVDRPEDLGRIAGEAHLLPLLEGLAQPA